MLSQKSLKAHSGRLALLGLVTMMAGALLANDEANKRNTARVKVEPSNQTWIGVQIEPVGEDLKSQLGIDGGMMVIRVLDDSPAAAAGLQRHDILLKLGTREIRSIEDLSRAVAEHEDKPAALVVMRRGAQRSIEILPKKRREPAVQWRGNLNWSELSGELGKLQLNPGTDRLRVLTMGPGALADFHIGRFPQKMPDNLEIAIRKQGDRPAEITVKRDGEQWQVTEDDLATLPDDVRPHVEGLLGRRTLSWYFAPGGRQFRLKDLRLDGDGAGGDDSAAGATDLRFKWSEAFQEEIRDHAQRVAKQLQQMLKEQQQVWPLRGQEALEELRKEIEEMRRELRALRDEKDAAAGPCSGHTS